MTRLVDTAITAFALTLGAPGAAPSENARISVSAWVTTAGPYGEMWELDIAQEITADGRAGVHSARLTIAYMLTPMGNMEGRFLLPEEAVESIRSLVETTRFFALPETLAPEALLLHMPTLRLEIRVGARRHKVELHDPARVREDPERQRFLDVWTEVFAPLPLQPSW